VLDITQYRLLKKKDILNYTELEFYLFVGVYNFISHSKGRTWIEGAEENI